MEIVNKIRIAQHKSFPEEIPIGLLEGILNQSFMARGYKVIDGYFDPNSPHYPQNLWFCVSAIEKSDFYNEDGNVVGGLVATKEEISSHINNDEFKFKYIDKVGVVPKRWENGIAKDMITAALKVYTKGEEKLPGACRTSSLDNHNYYRKKSDIWLPVENKVGTLYYIHGFGFRDKKTEKDLFKNASKIFEKEIVPYIAAMPQTIVRLQEPLKKYAA